MDQPDCSLREATLAVQRWLGLRLTAWQRGEAFDDHQITPQALRSLEVATHCPVTGRALKDDAQVVAVDAARGWVGGNLALLSPAMAERWKALTWESARAALARAEESPESLVDHLSLREWRRVVALKSLATPLPHEEAARVPLHVLPPNRLRLANPIQELQALLTLQLAVPGWGQRARLIAETLPLPLRNEFNLFFNSLLAQALPRTSTRRSPATPSTTRSPAPVSSFRTSSPFVSRSIARSAVNAQSSASAASGRNVKTSKVALRSMQKTSGSGSIRRRERP